jgi:hypothetical protein
MAQAVLSPDILQAIHDAVGQESHLGRNLLQGSAEDTANAAAAAAAGVAAGLDTFFLLMCGFMVFLMQLGFGESSHRSLSTTDANVCGATAIACIRR